MASPGSADFGDTNKWENQINPCVCNKSVRADGGVPLNRVQQFPPTLSLLAIGVLALVARPSLPYYSTTENTQQKIKL